MSKKSKIIPIVTHVSYRKAIDGFILIQNAIQTQLYKNNSDKALN